MQDEFNRLFLFNNGYNEEDALNYAISQSLGEAILPPSQRHLGVFSKDGNTQPDPVSDKISQVLAMVENARAKINELIDLDLSSNCQRKQTKKEENLSESQKIRRQQDAEYKEALKIAQDKEKAEEINKKEMEKIVNKMSNYTEMIKQKFREIGDEPKSGILIAITLPDGQRIKRNFSQKVLGNDVYIWAAADEQIISSGIQIGKFKLVYGTGMVLNDKKSLHDQKISTRTIFSIVDND